MAEPAADSLLHPDVLIRRLSHRPQHILRSMITIPSPDPPSSTEWPARASSLGALDRLPPEILMEILKMLDLQSFARFSSVCFRGHSLAFASHASDAYRDIVTLAREALFALGRLGLASAHSVADLYAALCSETCTSCHDYGVFLFLPTAQRCCWACLRYNPQLRLLSPRDAHWFFVLSKQSADQLPKIHVIPGKYSLAQKLAPENCVLTSVAAAQALGMLEHGSADKLAAASLKRYNAHVRRRSGVHLLGQFYQRGPRPVARGQDVLYLPTLANIPRDSFAGIAFLPFPSLSSPGNAEPGLWCWGCTAVLHLYSSSKLPDSVLKTIVPPESGCHPTIVLLSLERRAYTRKAFLRHIQHCYGAQYLVPALAEARSTE